MATDKQIEEAEDAADPSEREGQPVPRGTIDPDLISLPRRKPQVGPIVALSVVAIALLMLVKIFPDLRFALASEPAEYASTAALLDGAEPDDYVRVLARPDLLDGAIIRKSKGSYGHRVQPVIGSGGKLWLMTHNFHWHADIAHDLRYTGRLAVLGELPSYDQLSEFWLNKPASLRIATTGDLRSAVLAQAESIAVTGGDRVPRTAATTIEIAEIAPRRALVTTYYTEEVADEEAWMLVLREAGLEIDGGRAIGRGKDGETFLFEINHPGGAPAVAELLESRRVFAARVEPQVVQHSAAASELQGDDAALTIAGDRVQWQDIDLVRVLAAYPLDENARVLIATDRPDDYSHIPFIAALLAMALALFGFILARQLVQLIRDLRGTSAA